MTRIRIPILAVLPFWLAACASAPAPRPVAELAPPQWFAPLPHEGRTVDLNAWWGQQGDPLLAQLIADAQRESPTLAAAQARLAQARAARVAAGAALLPAVDAAVTSTRSNLQLGLPTTATTTQAQLQAGWEIDLFGAARNASAAGAARLAGAEAGWHEARVSVAADVANLYTDLRACEKLRVVTRQDAASRAETARLAELTANAGFMAPAVAALARASAAEANSRAVQQATACDVSVKSLVALTGVVEPALRIRLEAQPAAPRDAGAFAIASVPAAVLAQRPDVYAAERAVAAAAYDLGGAQAARYPRLTLSGAVGVGRLHTGGQDTDSDTWTIGPLAVSLPIFDGGRRRANVESARAQYDAAVIQYRAGVRRAAGEVEQALLNLQSTATRATDTAIAAQGYRASYAATESRYRTGLASLVELEEARRTRLAAEIAEVSLERERMLAWIALYRAAGGGWTRTAP
jgi:multidrug efflux system outer membrane protein